MKYDRSLFLKSVFDGDTIYFETVLPLKGEEINLLFPIKKIISVTDYGLQKEYKENKDYFVKDGKLIIPENSDIPTLEVDEYYVKKEAEIIIKFDPTHSTYRFDDERFHIFGEGSFMADKQIAISYVHDGSWNLFRQEPQKEKIGHFLHKLAKKEPINMVFYGDSITVGCNASGTEFGCNKPPYTEPWPVMIHKYLEDKYQTKINYINTSVGGVTSDWAIDNVEENVNKYKPDILFLAFGMNDGGFEKERHFNNIMKIINEVKGANPQVEIVLISTTVPNFESNWFIDGTHTEYIEDYKTINLPYVAICDMTHMHLDLLKRKKYKDMTGNNINHPNDFLIRIYAQTILTALGEKL